MKQYTGTQLMALEWEQGIQGRLKYSRKRNLDFLRDTVEAKELQARLDALKSQQADLDNSTESVDAAGGKDGALYKHRAAFTLPDGLRKEITGKTMNEMLQKTADALREWYEENGTEPKHTTPERQEKGITMTEWVGRLMEMNTLKAFDRHQDRGYWNNWIEPFFRGKSLAGIRHSDCQAFADHLSKTVSKTGEPMQAKTAKQILSLLRAIMQQACLDELIDRNPADNVKNRCKEGAERFRNLTEEEKITFLQVLPTIAEENVKLYAAISFATGMRPEEIIALRWDDYHTEEDIGYFTVTQAAKTEGQKGSVLKDTKTRAGNRRAIVSCKQIIPLIEAARKPDGFIIRGTKKGKDGKKPISEHQKTLLDNKLNGYLQAAGMARTTGYDLRVTHATTLSITGAADKSLIGSMGHTSADFTRNKYVREDWSQAKRDARKANDYWDNLLETQSGTEHKEKRNE